MTKANIDFERGLIWKRSQFVYRNLSSSKIWCSCLLNSQKTQVNLQSHSAGRSSSYFVDITLLISAINGDVFVLLAVKETPVLTRVTAATVMMWCANTEGSGFVRVHQMRRKQDQLLSTGMYTLYKTVCVCVISAKETLSEASLFYLPTATAPTHAALINTYKLKSWDSCKLANPGAPF